MLSLAELTAVALLLFVFAYSCTVVEQRAIETEQQRAACMLATDDEHENERCLPPVYGEDW